LLTIIVAGDIVRVSLSDPTSLTTLVYNTSTGSIAQQLYIDDTTNTLYYNSPGTLKMLGVSLDPPYNQVFTSTYLGINPSLFDFNPSLKAFVMGDLRFSNAYVWPMGASQLSKVYSLTSSGRVTGVKFFNDTHVLVAFQSSANYPAPNVGKLILVNINNVNDTTVVLRNNGMGASLLFDEKYCDFYFSANVQATSTSYPERMIYRKNLQDQNPSVYQVKTGTIDAITFDVSRRNLVVSQSIGKIYCNIIQ
jgi:hypothetical protein